MVADAAHGFADRLMERLDAAAVGGHRVTFWWRDDDAVEPTPALSRLVGLADHFDVPLGLAVIPKFATGELPSAITGVPRLRVLQHGWAHVNHQPAPRKKAELGDARRPGLVL